MSAKDDLIERLQFLDKAASLEQLIDIGVAASEHNSVANLLRKGLSIVAFNILEDFIKNRAYESLDELSSSGISFSKLPDFLQESAITRALRSLSFQADLYKKEELDYKLLIQQEAKKIAATSAFPFLLSKFSLLSSSSNITSNEIKDFLRAFGISGGWTQLKTISDLIGGGIPDLAAAYNLASQRRHNSAHSARFHYDSSWLNNLKSEIVSICASVDIAISIRCRQAKRLPLIPLSSHNLNDELNFRFLVVSGSFYRESKSIGGSSIKNWGELGAAVAHLQPQLLRRKEFLVVIDSRRRIENWFV